MTGLIRWIIPLLLAVLCAGSALARSPTGNTAPKPGFQYTGTWSTGNKDGFGTAYTYDARAAIKPSRVWFTLAGGVMTETFYPTYDSTAVSRMIFLVTDGHHYLADETKTFRATTRVLRPRTLSYRVVSTDTRHHITLTKEIVTDPTRNVVLVKVAMAAPRGTHLYVQMEPTPGNTSLATRGRIVHGIFEADKGSTAIALASSARVRAASVGYRLASDGLTQLQHGRTMRNRYTAAGPGRIAGTLEIPNVTTLALGFGTSPATAIGAATGSLHAGFSAVEKAYLAGWHRYATGLNTLGGKADDAFYSVAETIKAAEDKTYRGALVASPTHPFGESQPDDSANYGYAAVWSRDQYHAAMGLLAAGDSTTANEALDFMAKMQLRDGSWPRNEHVAYTVADNGDQLDETADPIMLAWRLGRQNLYASMVRRAADHLRATGPRTDSERWEENGGYSPSTLAAEIAALVCAADMAGKAGDSSAQSRYLSTADSWTSQLEKWTYTTTGPLDGHHYYVRLTQGDANDPLPLSLANGGGTYDARTVVDAGFLEYVRLGIRAPRDPHITTSLPVVDRYLESRTAKGPGWHRYNHDGYGDPPAGSASGQGHDWPVLSGERAMYDLIGGYTHDAAAILDALKRFAGPTYLIPEQVLEKSGGATTSARPLTWAQGEYLVLARSLADGQPFDMPSVVAKRYAAP